MESSPTPSASAAPLPTAIDTAATSGGGVGTTGVTIIICVVCAVLIASLGIYVFRVITTNPSEAFRNRLNDRREKDPPKPDSAVPSLPTIDPSVLDDYPSGSAPGSASGHAPLGALPYAYPYPYHGYAYGPDLAYTVEENGAICFSDPSGQPLATLSRPASLRSLSAQVEDHAVSAESRANLEYEHFTPDAPIIVQVGYLPHEDPYTQVSK
ncbi:hypothetical protein HDU91_005930 [Kappamyces sp. JEL0680]|nr:hypothetical protein HDU91_005930 [Kappamyces sp. JEL0680]